MNDSSSTVAPPLWSPLVNSVKYCSHISWLASGPYPAWSSLEKLNCVANASNQFDL